MISVKDLKAIHELLCRDNGLAALCTQNGWIDNDTLWFEVRDDAATVSVHFEEVVTKGGGCVAKRQPCWGEVRIDRRATERRVRPTQTGLRSCV